MVNQFGQSVEASHRPPKRKEGLFEYICCLGTLNSGHLSNCKVFPAKPVLRPRSILRCFRKRLGNKL
jgi:hypothetical protein